MRLGVHFVNYSPPPGQQIGPILARAAALADEADAAMFTLPDHFLGVGDAHNPFLECYTSLAFLAGQTSTITLSALVTGVTYRHAGELAKTVSTLDVLAGGRAVLGLGVGWYERGHTALGLPFPPVGERFEILEETLQVCLQMWSDNDGPFAGEHYQLAETICVPQPPRRTPILIAGRGEKKTLPLIAKYADIWSGAAESVEELEHKMGVLKRHCDAIGRDHNEIEKTVGFFFVNPFDNLDSYLKRAEAYAAQGISLVHVGVMPGNPDPIGYIERICEHLLPKLAEIG
ncbi:LLM class F420-dependent oxidoreductase [Mycobacterium sp. E796]|uniref:LLM class F420-dependent oxidoreductase n=1 Tax=Mycobacterium sp. E796 TaxID=1834151 RepID=UPI0008016BB6|nr:LLM class F420-dependent oxidoreductase [Mycobacterium sp. E796]OBI45402.1 LLM class F420-dependent oxidoreductase [Mycobacterium sp. E796]